jgi:hypothetical protein
MDLEDDEGGSWLPGSSAIDVIYEGTPVGSAARRLMVDLQVSEGMSSSLHSEEDLNLAYLSDVARSYAERLENEELHNKFPRFVVKAQDYFL